MKKTLFSAAAVGLAAVALFGASPASADPIVCPNGQTSQHTDAGWECVNGGGNGSGAGWKKGGDGGKI